MDKVFLVWWEERDWEGDSGIVDICATEEIALATKKNWEKECPNDNVWIEPWEIETEMPKILKDISKVHILTRFKLNRSDAEYTVMYGPDDEKFIVNLEEGYIYTIEGNSTDDGCRAKKYQINSKVIYGFGVPAY